jgi:hypothetical protein
MDLINHKVFFPDGSCQVDNFFTYIAFIPKICMYYLLKNSLIIHEENTKKNHKRVVSVYVIQIHVDLHKL